MKMTPFLEYVLYDIFEERDNVTARAMMGAYMLYMDAKPFAIVEDDILWLKGSNDLAQWYLDRGAKKFGYMKQGEMQGLNYFSVPEDVLENREEFREWVDVALSVAKLPKSKVKSGK
jgi:DNA transformation protein